MERLKDPDSAVRGSTFQVAIQFLRDNNIVISAVDSAKADLERQLSNLHSDLPFD